MQNRIIFFILHSSICILTGCIQPDPELDRVREITSAVKPVTEAGLTLDAQATPQQVVYALLQTLKDDVRADNDAAKRQEAFERTLALAAPAEIMVRFNRRTEAGKAIESREETLRRVVRPWASVVAYYVDSLDEPMDKMIQGMRVAPLERRPANKSGTTELQRVTLTVMDPSAPEDRNRRAILTVHLSKESDMWRVCYVGFEARPTVVPKKETETAPPPDSNAESTKSQE